MARRQRRLAPLIAIVVIAAASLAGVLVAGWSPHLGLDLQGGVSVVYQAKNDVPGSALDDAIEIIRSRVDALGVAEPDIVRQGNSIVVSLPGIKDRDRALEIIGRTAELQFRPVLATGQFISAEQLDQASTSTTAPGDTSSTDSTATTAPGDTSSTATTAAGETTTTTTPDSATTATTEGALGLTAGENAGGRQGQPEPTTAPPASDTSDTTATTAPGETTTTAPGDTTATTAAGGLPADTSNGACLFSDGSVEAPTPADAATNDVEAVFPDKDNQLCYRLAVVPTAGDRVLTGRVVSNPEATINQGKWSVTLNIKSGDLDLFNSVSSACYSGVSSGDIQCPVQQRAGDTSPTGELAIALDGVVQSALGFQTPTFGANGLQISGSFTQREARDLALVLRFGSLPVQLEPQTVQEVSATLGKDSLHAGLIAGFIGVALVLIYMLLYYRALGLVVLLGLTVWTSLNFTIVSYLGEKQGLALSLAGVTGIVVSVGVTVDSYVVYFERLKDEVRSGKSVRSSIDRGFQRAFRTILTADVSSFIGAFLLYFLTVGPVRGFAFFLGLSTVLDVVVAYFFTRPLVAQLGNRDFFTRSRMFGVARGTVPERAPASAPAEVAS